MSQDFALQKLMVAVENDNLQLIKTWLNACDSTTRNNVNFIDEYYLLLLTAINNNHKEIAKLLINSGCSMKSKHGNVEKLLQRAVINNDIEITTMLLARKAGISKNCTSSLLNKAVENRSIGVVRLLLSHNADVNYVDHQGMTVLQFLFENLFQDNAVIEIGDESVINIVKLLLSQEASVNFRSINGQTALHYAVRFGQKDVLHTILQKIENVNAISLSNLTPLHLLLMSNETIEENILDTISLFVLKGARADIPNYQNETACHIAARRKFIKVLHSLLLQCQNDINFCDTECCTVLHRILEDSITFSNRDDFNNLVNLMILKEPFCNIKNEYGKTPLHVAAENKQYEILNNMLFRVENLNVPDSDGDIVLHIFLRNLDNNFNFGDSLDIIKNLLTRGSNVDLANKMRQTSIHLAIQLKNLKLLSLVLNHSNDLNNIYMAQGWSILHIFSTIRDFIGVGDDIKISEVAEICINKGATVDLTDVCSQTPLALAVLYKNVAMVKVLLQYGANPNAKFDINKTVMHNLLMKNSVVDVEIAEALLAHEMEVDEPCLSIDFSDFKNKGDVLMIIVKHMKDVTKGNVFGNTMLHSVLQCNKFINKEEEERLCEFVTMLLSKGAPVDAKTILEKTALHFAVENKHCGVVKILLQHGADPKSLCFSKNSALHLISMQSTDTGTNMDKEIIDMIVEKGCLVNARNTFGMTPLLLAAKSGSTAVVKALIKHKAIVQCTVGKNCDSALHLAALENKWYVIPPIVESGADIHALRKDGKTALHLAAAHARSLATRFLLSMGADPDMRDNDGRTALHVACWNNSWDNVSCLLEYGADVNVEDNFKIVPLMLAQNWDGMIEEKLIYHLKKLEVMRMYISPVNQNLVETKPRPAGIVPFVIVINREMKGMSQILIEKHVPLCDVLQMRHKRIYALKNNKIFQHLMNTPYLKLKFPHVADLIRSRYKNGVIREHFLSIGRVALPKLLGFQLPEVCCNQIFMYLSNENLQKLVTAARLVFGRKRKGPVRVTVVKRARCAFI